MLAGNVRVYYKAYMAVDFCDYCLSLGIQWLQSFVKFLCVQWRWVAGGLQCSEPATVGVVVGIQRREGA